MTIEVLMQNQYPSVPVSPAWLFVAYFRHLAKPVERLELLLELPFELLLSELFDIARLIGRIVRH